MVRSFRKGIFSSLTPSMEYYNKAKRHYDIIEEKEMVLVSKVGQLEEKFNCPDCDWRMERLSLTNAHKENLHRHNPEYDPSSYKKRFACTGCGREYIWVDNPFRKFLSIPLVELEEVVEE